MPMTKEETKEAFKEVLREFLDEKYAQFGRWSLHTLLAMIVGAACYFMLAANGWYRP